ncbi:elongation factor P [Candidatus Curtissbacteria bacterium]|nr:elongation factor P [Candidatus Curtissbacteria bacterium]
MINATELRAGIVFIDQGQYLLVLTYEHIKMGRGSGTIKVKVKNLVTGANVEKSFITGARVQEASLERNKVQFLYKDASGYHFMDTVSYEQFDLPDRLVGYSGQFLKEGLEIQLFAVDGKPMYIDLPKILDYKVTQTGGASRGNSVGATQKEAVLENGLKVKVPLFINNGEVIRIDTRDASYVERAK